MNIYQLANCNSLPEGDVCFITDDPGDSPGPEPRTEDRTCRLWSVETGECLQVRRIISWRIGSHPLRSEGRMSNENGDAKIETAWWFGSLEHQFYEIPYIGNFIIPSDSVFFRGVAKNHQPDHNVGKTNTPSPSHHQLFFSVVSISHSQENGK